MSRSKILVTQDAEDESWRKELCPDCGARLVGFAAWKDHGPRHRWGSEWLAARRRAPRPGEVIRIKPGAQDDSSNYLGGGTGEDATWQSAIPAVIDATIQARSQI